MVQVEAYLNKKESVFFHSCLFTARTMGCKKENHQDHPNQDALNGMLNEFIIELEKKIKFVEARKDNQP
ncbi:hypothetical protein NXX92_00055 [Phocaeicola vulgatus]|nr:hypothetical protein [Phocaeicola vulgatus]MCS2399933.1 hypothetical protein [Phocaeicola vulgatus]